MRTTMTTGELQLGDIVYIGQVRLRLDTEPPRYWVVDGRRFWQWNTAVANLDEVLDEGLVSKAMLTNEVRDPQTGEVIDNVIDGRWHLVGDQDTVWDVERGVDTDVRVVFDRDELYSLVKTLEAAGHPGPGTRVGARTPIAQLRQALEAARRE